MTRPSSPSPSRTGVSWELEPPTYSCLNLVPEHDRVTDTWTIANNSAFENIYRNPDKEDILLGGLGNIVRFTGGKTENTTEIPRGYEIWFDDLEPNPVTRAKRYLLRLINTAFDTTFIFSIDNHNFTVVEADFVPVQPFNATSILIAIGQRYHVIVEATPVVNSSDPSANPLPADGNYWIRTWVADDCGLISKYIGDWENYMKTGILRYDNTSTADPSTEAWHVSLECSDTAFNDLIEPVVPWKVGDPSNGEIGEQFNIDDLTGAGPYATSFFSFERPDSKEVTPFQTAYGNPTFLNLDNVGDEWPSGWVVVPENYTEEDWVSTLRTSSSTIPSIVLISDAILTLIAVHLSFVLTGVHRSTWFSTPTTRITRRLALTR